MNNEAIIAVIGAACGAMLSFTVSLVMTSLKRATDTRDLASELRASVAALTATVAAVSQHVARLDQAISELPCRQCEPYERKTG